MKNENEVINSELSTSEKCQLADCRFINACKEYFGGKKHHQVCDRFAQLLCDHANNNGNFSERIKNALGEEKAALKKIFSRERWGVVFKNMYGYIEYCLNLSENGEEDRAIEIFLASHDYLCGKPMRF